MSAVSESVTVSIFVGFMIVAAVSTLCAAIIIAHDLGVMP
jgi:hypothetical protein